MKKVLSVFLSLTLLLSIASGLGITAKADDVSIENYFDSVNEIHYIGDPINLYEGTGAELRVDSNGNRYLYYDFQNNLSEIIGSSYLALEITGEKDGSAEYIFPQYINDHWEYAGKGLTGLTIKTEQEAEHWTASKISPEYDSKIAEIWYGDVSCDFEVRLYRYSYGNEVSIEDYNELVLDGNDTALNPVRNTENGVVQTFNEEYISDNLFQKGTMLKVYDDGEQTGAYDIVNKDFYFGSGGISEIAVKLYTAQTEEPWQDGVHDVIVYFCGRQCTVPVTVINSKTHDHVSGNAVEENRIAPTVTAEGSYDEVLYCAKCGVEISRTKKTIPLLPSETPELIGDGAVIREKIVIEKPALKSLKSGKKRFKASWSHIDGVTGYEVQYSTSKSFSKGVKAKKIKGEKKLNSLIKGLKSKKKYYVRVRAYDKSGKTTYYSSWSKAKSVKIS